MKPASHGQRASWRLGGDLGRRYTDFYELMPQVIDGHVFRVFHRHGLYVAMRPAEKPGVSVVASRYVAALNPTVALFEALRDER